MAPLTKFERAKKFIPNLYGIGNNQILTALVGAWCQSDESVAINIEETHDQLFVRLADGRYLDYAGSNKGVYRPTIVPIGDEQYREYILAAGMRPKQVRKLIYELLEIFWGPETTHSNTVSTAWSTYDFTGVPHYLTLIADNEPEKTIKFEATDFAAVGSATAAEVCAKINFIYGERVTADVYTDLVTSRDYVRIRTNTPGLSGSIQITGGSANLILGFFTEKIQKVDVTVIEMFPKHIILKIPAEVLLKFKLKGSHHFHANATIIDPRPAPITSAAPYWPGSFFYDYNNPHTLGYSPANKRCTTVDPVSAGAVINQLAVDNCGQFDNSSGYVMFGYGTYLMEMVPYTGRISNAVLAIDPTYTFLRSWPVGSTITALTAQWDPRTDGSDYPIYFEDTHVGYELAKEIVELIKAAGVILEFDIIDTYYLYQGYSAPWYNYGGGGGGAGGQAWFQPPIFDAAAEAAMIAAFGMADRGKIWANDTTGQLMLWNGTAPVILA